MAVPTAFISYAWEDKEFMIWVRQLAHQLREDYVDAKLDQWEAIPGDQLPVFMERAISENDFVLLLCTPIYRKKSEMRYGGVGYEGDVITAEVFKQQNHRKFIPLLVKGEWEESAPSWMQGKYFIDLRDTSDKEENYKKLINTLQGKNDSAPPLGKKSNGIKSDKDKAELSFSGEVRINLNRKNLEVAPGQEIHLPPEGVYPASTYIFSQKDIDAVNITISASRPLIVIAEPGMGENEFARAVSIALDYNFIKCRLTRTTKINDLLWQYDPNERLLEAQVLAQRADIDISNALSISRFVSPGALWWAFDWASAAGQVQNGKNTYVPVSQDTNPENGCVLHIEAVDRADSDMLLDLVEILEASSFTTADSRSIKSINIPPLIIMTSNMEKELPDSLIRKCIIFQLRAPQQRE